MRRLLPCGSRALLVECADGEDARGLWQWLDSDPPPGVEDLGLGARTVLVCGDLDATVRRLLLTTTAGRDTPQEWAELTIAVRYDGVDLADVAAATGLDADEVRQRHAAAAYTVAFAGFVPGFAYLVGLDPALRLPRRPSPRPRVPAGAVAIAESYTAVYPRETPGGWHLLGSTDAELFDASREPAAALRPGMTVRFEAA